MIAKAEMTALLSFLVLCLNPALLAQTQKRLWVLRPPGEIVEYNPSTWTVKTTFKVPPEAARSPQSLALNSSGQILFCPVVEGEAANLPPGSAAGRVWLWDGQKGAYLERGAVQKSTPAAGGSVSAVESLPRCFLSADGHSLYWFANEFRILRNAEGLDRSVTTTFRAWQTDLAGEHRNQIAGFEFSPCECGTGACSETCPEAAFWIPDGGVDDFFLLTRWIPGQIGATYESSSLFRKSQGKWTEYKLTRVLEEVKDAAQGGDAAVYVILDEGCCGWDNASDDQTILVADGKETVIFDERKRFGNPNYDVSFFTSSARLSPDRRSVAMTIASTEQPGAEIRLSDQGKPDPGELARIRKSLAGLPAVEALRTDDPAKRIAVLPRATLAGWLSDSEILVVENGLLVALDVGKGTRRTSRIKVENDSLVFVR